MSRKTKRTGRRILLALPLHEDAKLRKIARDKGLTATAQARSLLIAALAAQVAA